MEIRTPQERKRKERATALVQPERGEKEPHRLEQLRNIVDLYRPYIMREYRSQPNAFKKLELAASLVLFFPDHKEELGLGDDTLWKLAKKGIEESYAYTEESRIHAAALLVQLYPERRTELQEAVKALHIEMYITATAEELEKDPSEAVYFLELWRDYIVLFPEQRKNIPTQLITEKIVQQPTVISELQGQCIATLRIVMPQFDHAQSAQSMWHMVIAQGVLVDGFEEGKRGLLGKTEEALEQATVLAFLVADEVVIDESGVHLISESIQDAPPPLPIRSVV